MTQHDDDGLEAAIAACKAAASKMSAKRAFRLRVLLQMVQHELDKEQAERAAGQRNGHKDHPPGSH